jgi:hypothetical protein
VYDSSEKIAKATHCGDNESNAQNENDDNKIIIASKNDDDKIYHHRIDCVEFYTRPKLRDDKIIAIKLCTVVKIYLMPEIFYGGSKGGGPPLLVVVTNRSHLTTGNNFWGVRGEDPPTIKKMVHHFCHANR